MAITAESSIEEKTEYVQAQLKRILAKLPKSQHRFFAQIVSSVCLGRISEQGGLLELRAKYGVRAELAGREVFNDIRIPKPNP